MRMRRDFRYGIIFGIVSVLILAAICLIPLENLISVRPNYKSYTIDWCYLYLHRLALFSLILLLLTAVTAYLVGTTDFLKGTMTVQALFFVISHYLYLYKLSQVSEFTLRPFVYYVNNIAHLDLGQIVLIVIVLYMLIVRLRRLHAR